MVDGSPVRFPCNRSCRPGTEQPTRRNGEQQPTSRIGHCVNLRAMFFGCHCDWDRPRNRRMSSGLGARECKGPAIPCGPFPTNTTCMCFRSRAFDPLIFLSFISHRNRFLTFKKEPIIQIRCLGIEVEGQRIWGILGHDGDDTRGLKHCRSADPSGVEQCALLGDRQRVLPPAGHDPNREFPLPERYIPHARHESLF